MNSEAGNDWGARNAGRPPGSVTFSKNEISPGRAWPMTTSGSPSPSKSPTSGNHEIPVNEPAWRVVPATSPASSTSITANCWLPKLVRVRRHSGRPSPLKSAQAP